MKNIVEITGLKIRNYRRARKLSQEKFADMCGVHPTYIGQIERGEKNATLETLDKICCALGISLSELFDGADNADESNAALLCYKLILEKSPEEQRKIYSILKAIDEYKTI